MGQALLKPQELHKACVDHVRSQRLIWHFCTPKSASTFLMNTIRASVANTPGIAHFNVVPMRSTRQQVVCAYTAAQSISLHLPADVMIGPHLHSLATEDLTSMISDNHAVVIQTRPLLDTVISMFDHFNRNPRVAYAVTASAVWQDLSDDEKVDYLIYCYIPWHVQFLQSWDAAASEGKRINWVGYQQAVKEPGQTTAEILDLQAIKGGAVSELPVESKNFNVGQAGRGRQQLSAAQIYRITSVVNTLNRTWKYRHALQDGSTLL